MEFHLETWGDGTIRLVHWDALHGDDVIFILGQDGIVARSYDGDESVMPVKSLAVELSRLAKKEEYNREHPK